MEVILKQDVPKLGKKGSVINVKEGYFFNCLMPQNKAVQATSHLKKQLVQKEAKAVKTKEYISANAASVKELLSNKVLDLGGRVSSEDNLYSAIHDTDIIQAVQEKFNIKLDRKNISLKDKLKKLGTYTVNIKLVNNINFDMTLNIIAK